MTGGTSADATAGVAISTRGGVREVAFDRPERMNSVRPDMLAIAVDAVAEAAEDPAVRVIALTGTGRAFCAGAALGFDSDAEAVAFIEHESTGMIDLMNALATTIVEAPKPVVAVVNGPAVGVGMSFALACDFAVASDAAFFKPGFEGIGLMPDGGGTVFFAAALGRSQALASILLGDRIPAQDALAAGLVARVWPDAEFRERAEELLQQLAAGSAPAAAAAKRAVNALTLPTLADALAFEREHQQRLLRGADFAEGVAAFAQRRAPRFE
jgi:enoyl-CoA hydratase